MIKLQDIRNFWNKISDLLIRKEEGKSLSSNDYTNEEKQLLETIEEKAQVNVNSDWNEQDETSSAYVKNKPSNFPTSTSKLVNDINALVGNEDQLETDSKKIIAALNEIYKLWKEQKDIEDAYYKLVELIISGSSSISGASSTYSYSYSPPTATVLNPVWSISGTGVSIDQSGKVSVANGTENEEVIITLKVLNCDNNEVIATKTITVTNLTLEALSILGDATITGTGQYSVTATPTNADSSVNWSITSGGTYASISSSGVVTASSEAWKSSVTIKATSKTNSTISATKDITVSTTPTLEISGKDSINIEGDYTCTVTPSTATSDLPITWSITNGETYASISSSGKVSVSENAGETERTVTIQAKSGTYTATKTIKVTYIVSSDTLLWDVDFTGNGSKYEQYTSSVMQQNEGLTEWTMLVYVNNGSTGFYHALSDGAAQSLSNSPQAAADALNIHSFGNWSQGKMVFSLNGVWIEGSQWNAGDNISLTYAIRRQGSIVQYSKDGTTWTTTNGSTWNTSGNKLTVGADGEGNSPATDNTRIIVQLYDKYEISQSLITDFFNAH